jgi:hypothetical protein
MGGRSKVVVTYISNADGTPEEVRKKDTYNLY